MLSGNTTFFCFHFPLYETLKIRVSGLDVESIASRRAEAGTGVCVCVSRVS